MRRAAGFTLIGFSIVHVIIGIGDTKTAPSARSGFSLIQISILLTVASLVLVVLLPSSQSNLTAASITTTRMYAILTALRDYQAANGALPCPADATQARGSSNYGVAAANGGPTTNCTGGSPAANFIDATNHVAIGMVPWLSLGLSSDYALDGWGRDIDYAVDTYATACWSANATTGQITVYDNGSYNNSVAALISHGPDGHGAYVPYTAASGTASQLNAGYAASGAGPANTDADQLVNAHLTIAFAQTNNAGSGNGTTPASSEASTGTTFIRKPPSTASGTFDDLVVYRNPLWNINTPPASTVGITCVDNWSKWLGAAR